MTRRMVFKGALVATLLIGRLSAQELVSIPAGSYDAMDQITGLKLSIEVSEFLLGSAEVTQEEYEGVAGENPSTYKGSTRPVENVSWWDAIRYCNLRSAKEGLPECYDLTTGRRDVSCNGYRLPTEAEWIVAAGAMPAAEELKKAAHLGVEGTKTSKALEASLESGTMPVRSLKPNSHGASDMRGNVWEWCDDYFDAVTSPDSVRDPMGPASGLARVIRGGSFVSTTSR